MKKIQTTTLTLGFLAAIFCLVALGLPPGKAVEADAPEDVVISFDTSQVTERVWYGTASGGVTGDVTVETSTGAAQLFRGTWTGRTRWQIGAGSSSFVAEMGGKINSYNGVLIMRGRVIDGADPGARVFAQGQVTSINPHHLAGTIRVIQP